MKLIFWGGVLLFLGSIALLASNYDSIKVERSGQIVKMRIEKLPNSCLGTKVKHFVTLSYNNEIYTKQIGGKFCDEHGVGELVDMKILAHSDIVLFPQESAWVNLVSFGILGIFGLVMIIYQWKKVW